MQTVPTTKTVTADIQKEVTDKILRKLEQGVAPWVRPWRTVGKGKQGGALPHNAVTGRPYSGVNFLMLAMEQLDRDFSTAGWLTFNQAAAVGGSVRKGEKGTAVYFAKMQDRTRTVQDMVTGEEREESFSVPMWRRFWVFNVAQVEGLPAHLAPQAGLPKGEGVEDELAAIAQRCDLRGGFLHGGNQAYYNVFSDKVVMPQVEAFESVDHYACTLLHELTHATGHEHRLGRDMQGRYGDESYAFEELVAELGAAFTCAALGIDGELRHADYIAHWLTLLGRDQRAIFRAASQARKAAAYLLGELDGEGEQCTPLPVTPQEERVTA
ncbi:MAG: DUF1738 domain-containing protein [Blastochloris viridis]|uniref:DUF1738 domain-containing protein n=1 Tax=Blastochloris viridis TaxID=1079 RepID=A0A6N4RBS7_BLAVI|nr:MAG: DUF1738 domain-containing protein [Blastochloris viridis]